MVSLKATPREAPVPATAHHDPARTIAFFGHDSTESTVIKRVKAFQACNTRVIGFMFRRGAKSSAAVPWENIDLGTTVDRHYLLRLGRLLTGLIRVLRHRRSLRQCQVYYARNIDMLLLAVVARTLLRSRAPVVYEVLDVPARFRGAGTAQQGVPPGGAIADGTCPLLVVSSPDFMSEYFRALSEVLGALEAASRTRCLRPGDPRLPADQGAWVRRGSSDGLEPCAVYAVSKLCAGSRTRSRTKS